MGLSFQKKLLLIVVAMTLAFATLIGVSSWLALAERRELADIEGRLVPKLELGPRLEAEFAELRKVMQDAVAAQDPATLEQSVAIRDRLLALASPRGEALSAADAAAIRHSVSGYHRTAYDVSVRLLRGETGEALVDDIAKMQSQQRATEALMQRATRLDEQELAKSFGAVRKGIDTAARYHFLIGIGTLVLVLALTLGVGRDAVRALGDISRGVSRFATGDFSEAIPVHSQDELGALAKETNQMASALQRLAEQRDRSDWVKAGAVGLSEELRGELEPNVVAERAVKFLARRAEAAAAVLYLLEDDGMLSAAAHYAGAAGAEEAAQPRFRPGEGLLGQAALSDELTLVEAPEDYVPVRSGLGEARPRVLVFLPLRRRNSVLGVLELALFRACSDRLRELLGQAQGALAIALDVARSRAAQRVLYARAQEQAERLLAQEEELRLSNRELRAQQEELRHANEELEAQRSALSTQNAELEEARERLNLKAEELSRVSSYKSQFLANMSHELRTPLNSMLLLSHLLSENEEGRLSPKQVEFAKTIHSAGKDLLSLINQVLDLAKIEAGHMDLALSDVALSDVVESMRRLFAEAAAQRGLEFEVELEPGLPEQMHTDRRRLEGVLVNLLGNALKFTEHGRIALAVRRVRAGEPAGESRTAADGLLAFVVTDTGIGIPALEQQKVFAPFEQLESKSDRRYGGTGLGLAIARESARRLGGDLVLASRPGEGSTFTLYVPGRVEPSALARERKPRVTTAPRPADDRERLGERDQPLLVVEDDPVFAERLLDIIHGRRFKALIAKNGEEALALARERRPRGIILDVKLPDIDGFAVMERLRASPETRDIPVHVISGLDASARALELGAIGYLAKPTTREEIGGAVRALTRPRAGEAVHVLVVEDDVNAGSSVVELLRADGFQAEHVTSAEQALSALATRRFACIVLDLGLPDMDGLSLLERLRQSAPEERVAIIVHTGRALTRVEAARIEAYTEAVVLKDGKSGERLLDEVRLFVQHLNEAGTSEAQSRVELAADISLSGKRILIADDDMRTIYALSALLRGKGADVSIAENGREALALIEEQRDLSAVLMDVMMPEMDGYEAMRRLRQLPHAARLPVLALTARAMKGERERCLAAGATDYLAKPVEPARLLALLGSWFSESRT